MNLKTLRVVRLLTSLILLMISTGSVLTMQPAHTRPALPNPILFFTGQELFTSGGKQFVRYNFAVDNASSYPDELFAAAPELPPCGKNTKASRTWVDLYDQSGKRLYGFCALEKSKDLSKIWFTLEQGVIPPSFVYIEMNDRKTNTKYKSNLAETTL
ncbi:MAG: hypothetical protein DMF68_20535 [Acidobacteria bacterium]|nr:MAG: hypothetical protein DMF68_20535 [Acidobacteriota bacterium]